MRSRPVPSRPVPLVLFSTEEAWCFPRRRWTRALFSFQGLVSAEHLASRVCSFSQHGWGRWRQCPQWPTPPSTQVSATRQALRGCLRAGTCV